MRNGYKIVNGRKQSDDGFVCGTETSVIPYRSCVAVKRANNAVMVRDTKDKMNTTLTFTHDEWNAFIKGVKKGEFDL